MAQAFLWSFSKSAIKAAFKDTGLYPFNPELIKSQAAKHHNLPELAGRNAPKDRAERAQRKVDEIVAQGLPKFTERISRRRKTVLSVKLPAKEVRGREPGSILRGHLNQERAANNKKKQEQMRKARGVEERKRKREQKQQEEERKRKRRKDEKDAARRNRAAKKRMGCKMACGRVYSECEPDESQWVDCNSCKTYTICPQCYVSQEGKGLMKKHEANHKIMKKK